MVKRKRTKKTKLWGNGTGVINLLVQRSCLPESWLLLAWIDGGGETPLEELEDEKEQATCILKNRSE